MAKKKYHLSKHDLSKKHELKKRDDPLQMLLQSGLEHHRGGRTKEALKIYQEILRSNEQNFTATHMSGVACKQLGLTAEALNYFEAAISLQRLDASLQSNYGNLLLSINRYEEAINAYNVAIAVRPDFSDAHYNKGIALNALENYQQAVLSYSQAIKLDQNCADYYLCRGNSLQDLESYDLAISDYLACLEIRKNDYAALLNLGIAYFKQRKFVFSLTALQNAQSIQAQDPTLHYYKGNVLSQMGQCIDAITCYLRAIEIEPNDPRYFIDLGNSQLDLGRISEAIQSYSKALEIEPSYPFLLGHLVHVKCQVADWHTLPAELNSIRVGVEEGRKVSAPFPLLALVDSSGLAQKASEIYCQDQLKGDEKSIHTNLKIIGAQKKKKLKIGYFSSDFYRHATAYLMAQLFESHDESQFEIIGFSFSFAPRDEMSERIEVAFDQYFDVSGLVDQEVAKLSRQLGIDIAVDLKGYTQNSRSTIFAYRCAPVQVSYLGYPGTMSAPYIDFIIADKTVIPLSEKKYYSESVVYLPHCYQVNDSKRLISPIQSTRMDHGLPEDAFVFCCFNNTYKIQPDMFALWMRILKRAPESVLWLIEDSEQAKQNLKKHAQRHHVDCSRLVFAKRLNLPNHLERHRHAQLFLDTSPYNAHTTASDALWGGLLVLTLVGRSFASRVCASLLNELKLDEFICKTDKEYEEQAVNWVKNKELLEQQRKKLKEAKKSSMLFRGDLFAKSLELAYTKMYFQYEKGHGFSSIDLTN